MKRFVLLALLALSILVGGLATTASAAASNGAIKINDAHCHYEDDGAGYCATANGVATETETRVGNTIYTANMRVTFANYDAKGTLISTTVGNNHQVRLFKQAGEELHLLSERFGDTTMMTDGRVCTYTYSVQMVDGHIKFHNVERVCN